jgi:hypothetical protein
LTQIGRFNREKTRLKAELMRALFEADRGSDLKRTQRFASLAEQQASDIAALETLAEEIRCGLARVREAPPPSLPPLPPGLRERIDAYTHDRNALVAEFDAALQRRRAQATKIDIFVASQPDFGPTRTHAVIRSRELPSREDFEAEFARDQAGRIEALHARYEKLRIDLSETARGMNDPRTGQPMTIEALLRAYHIAMERFASIGRREAMYSHYQVAMFQPGLSPAQRRLLFAAAHASLAQPLPESVAWSSFMRFAK